MNENFGTYKNFISIHRKYRFKRFIEDLAWKHELKIEIVVNGFFNQSIRYFIEGDCEKIKRFIYDRDNILKELKV